MRSPKHTPEPMPSSSMPRWLIRHHPKENKFAVDAFNRSMPSSTAVFMPSRIADIEVLLLSTSPVGPRVHCCATCSVSMVGPRSCAMLESVPLPLSADVATTSSLPGLPVPSRLPAPRACPLPTSPPVPPALPPTVSQPPWPSSESMSAEDTQPSKSRQPTRWKSPCTASAPAQGRTCVPEGTDPTWVAPIFGSDKKGTSSCSSAARMSTMGRARAPGESTPPGESTVGSRGGPADEAVEATEAWWGAARPELNSSAELSSE
mmetsp:Transcript_44041/g.141224  ORF Transcript_44041/g.141224 Transcript_44041/m.141224 type:complete len:262 (+) Transcript_44041:119-904(+)